MKQSQKRLQKAAQRAPAGSQTPATDPVLDWIFNTHQPYHANDPGVPGKEHFILLRLPLMGTLVAEGGLWLPASIGYTCGQRWFPAACKHLCACSCSTLGSCTHWQTEHSCIDLSVAQSSCTPANWLIRSIRWRSFFLLQACSH